MATKLKHIPLTLDVLEVLVPMLKAEGYTIATGMMYDVPAMATRWARQKGNALEPFLGKGEDFKYMDKGEKALLYAVWNATGEQVTTARTASTRKRSAGTKSPRFANDAERMAYVRSFRQSSGKSAPQKSVPQPSGAFALPVGTTFRVNADGTLTVV